MEMVSSAPLSGYSFVASLSKFFEKASYDQFNAHCGFMVSPDNLSTISTIFVKKQETLLRTIQSCLEVFDMELKLSNPQTTGIIESIGLNILGCADFSLEGLFRHVVCGKVSIHAVLSKERHRAAWRDSNIHGLSSYAPNPRLDGLMTILYEVHFRQW